MSARYAVYFVPGDDTGLAAFGNQILGRDALANDVSHSCGGHPLRPVLASAISRYGFHATLKAPFELRSEESEKALCEAVKQLSGSLSPVRLSGLKPRRLNRHIVLSSESDSDALRQLATRCVMDIEPYRAPLRPADYQRRVQPGMSTRQRQNLEQYGYAHVFEDFRFHMTLGGPILTGPDTCIDETSIAAYLDWLNVAYLDLVTETPMLDRLVLSYQQDQQSEFVRLDQWVF